MRKPSIALLFLLLVSLVSGAQDSKVLLETLQRNFRKADGLDVKLKVLEDSVKIGSDGMGPLYLNAVDFSIDNSSSLETDAVMQQLALYAVDQIKEYGFAPAKTSLWRLFGEHKGTMLRVSILNALGIVGQGDATVVKNMVSWLETQNSLFFSGAKPDIQTVLAAVVALGTFKNTLAFSVLFKTNNLQYSEQISELAEKALLSLEGDLKESLMDLIKTADVSEKLAALEMGLKSERLSDNQKADIAEVALELGMYTTTSDMDEQAVTREMRYVALNALSERKWSKATSLAIEHFGMTLLEYERGVVAKTFLLDAIDGLGNMGTHEAAERLAQFLDLTNSYTEHGRAYDEQIVLAVLANLKKLGDKVAFANLSYTQYLNYSNTVKQAANEAIENIKW